MTSNFRFPKKTLRPKPLDTWPWFFMGSDGAHLLHPIILRKAPHVDVVTGNNVALQQRWKLKGENKGNIETKRKQQLLHSPSLTWIET